MTERPEGCRRTVTALMIAVGVMYMLIALHDLTGIQLPISHRIIKWVTVMLVAAIASVVAYYDRSRASYKICLAAVLTVIAEYFLLFSEEQWVLGMAVLSVAVTVRVCHFASFPFYGFLLFMGAMAGDYYIMKRIGNDPLTSVGMEFALLFVFALIFSLARKRVPTKQLTRAAFGMVLFACCNICILLYNLYEQSDAIYKVAEAFMWVFFVPSQVLLAMELY